MSQMNLGTDGVSASAAAALTVPSALRLPRLDVAGTEVTATTRRVFANAHAYHINSISINSDGETYISADDLRVNLWNLNISDHSFSESHATLPALIVPRTRLNPNALFLGLAQMMHLQNAERRCPALASSPAL